MSTVSTANDNGEQDKVSLDTTTNIDKVDSGHVSSLSPESVSQPVGGTSVVTEDVPMPEKDTRWHPEHKTRNARGGRSKDTYHYQGHRGQRQWRKRADRYSHHKRRTSERSSLAQGQLEGKEDMAELEKSQWI